MNKNNYKDLEKTFLLVLFLVFFLFSKDVNWLEYIGKFPRDFPGISEGFEFTTAIRTNTSTTTFERLYSPIGNSSEKTTVKMSSEISQNSTTVNISSETPRKSYKFLSTFVTEVYSSEIPRKMFKFPKTFATEVFPRN